MTSEIEEFDMSQFDTRELRWSAWMRAALDGDESQYHRLLSEIAQRLRIIAQAQFSRLGFGDSDVEDVVQEALIALHAKRGSWDAERPILPWVHAIARHKLLDAARKLGRGKAVTVAAPVEEWAEFLPTPRAEHASDGGRLDIARLLDALPSGQRNAVLAMSVEGLSAREAAARHGGSEGAMRVALHRGLGRLRALATER